MHKLFRTQPNIQKEAFYKNKLLTIFANISILGDWLDSKYASAIHHHCIIWYLTRNQSRPITK